MNKDKACLHIADNKYGKNNYPFLAGPEGDGFKNMLYSLVHLKKVLGEHGVDLSTDDINLPEESGFLFCWDNPHTVTTDKKKGQVWTLMINDPPMYCPESWDPNHHERFDFVLTFDETLVDNKKYFYYPFAVDTEFFSLPQIATEEEFSQRMLATTVSHAIHKYPDQNPGSTLHRRYDTIKWYGHNHPEDFRFYGGTFIPRHYYFGFRGVRYLRMAIPERTFHALARFMQRDLVRVYGGELGPLDKFEVIKNYRFYYCYENTIGINGYVCEKIFDCFYMGIVPIYWGAPNIHELIPYKCFIDGSQFKSEAEVYDSIKSMDYATWKGYIEEAITFLQSVEMERFTVEHSIECILAPIKEKIDNFSAQTSSSART